MLLNDWAVRTENPWEANLFMLPAFATFNGGNVGWQEGAAGGASGRPAPSVLRLGVLHWWPCAVLCCMCCAVLPCAVLCCHVLRCAAMCGHVSMRRYCGVHGAAMHEAVGI
jgi:hypothetical protein